MERREFLKRGGVTLLSLGAGLAVPLRALADSSYVSRIAFGSCLRQNRPQPVWRAITRANPDLFVFLGDNVYADTEDMERMRESYRQLAVNPDFARFRSEGIPVIATWDDHDFGYNDVGSEYPRKEESKKIMLDFFGEPELSARRSRAGIYTSYLYGNSPNRLQVILLDLRTFRDPIPEKDSGEGTLLGEEQWRWLEAELKRPADLRILGSSIQLVGGGHPWEKWDNFPGEKARLLRLIDEARAHNLIVISGDMHFAELSREPTPAGFLLHDLTSSGLNVPEGLPEFRNPKRVYYRDGAANFGMIRISWRAREVKVRLEAHYTDGERIFAHDLYIQRR